MAALHALWSLRQRRPYFVVATLLVLASLLVYPAVDWWLRSAGVAPSVRFWDYGAYAGAVNRWLDGGPLYTPNENGSYHGSYLYPPVALLLFAPFSLLFTFQSAALAWVLFSLALLWVGVARVVAVSGLELVWWERLGLLWLLLGFHPLLLSAKMGQTAAFLTALLCGSFVLLVAVDPEERLTGFASGALTGAVGVVKLAYAPAGAHLLRDRTRLLGAVSAGVSLAALSVVVFGVDAHRTYLAVLEWGFAQGGGARPPTLWGAPYYRPLYWLPATQALRVGASLAIAAGVVLADETATRESFALGVAAVPLLAPQTYTYYLVAAVPAVVVLLAGELRRGTAGYPLVPVVATLLLQVHAYGLKLLVDVLPRVVPATAALRPVAPALQPALWGNLLLVGLAGYRVAGAVPGLSLGWPR